MSTQFTSGTSNAISGYTIGIGYHVSKYLHALIGFSLVPVSEPSPGFITAAANYVSAHQSQYPGYSPAGMLANAQNAFDGFSYSALTTASGTGAPVFSGDVTTTHYQGGLFIGVAFPLTLKSHLE